MNRDQLQTLSFEELKELAMEEGVALIRPLDKDTLIEQLIELYSEDEDEAENNPAMIIKEKTFDLTKADQNTSAEMNQVWELPERYNETKVMLLLRDPNWAFAYWDIKDADIELYRDNPLFKGLFLRAYRFSDSSSKQHAEYFDIPVKLQDMSWYINLPEQGMNYFVELRVRFQSEERVLCTSNTISSPLERIHEGMDQDAFRNSGNDYLLLSGLYGFGDSSSLVQDSKKIISLLDNQYPNAGA
ncbi:MAG TPA: DUF4912 domain-containing protein [Spirochaetia bacterium]|nr:DUF4912 domain-containing protein [Spirochaetia bacterium]